MDLLRRLELVDQVGSRVPVEATRRADQGREYGFRLPRRESMSPAALREVHRVARKRSDRASRFLSHDFCHGREVHPICQRANPGVQTRTHARASKLVESLTKFTVFSGANLSCNQERSMNMQVRAISKPLNAGLVILLLASPLARAGNESGHGGDIQCDGAIQLIAQDLRTWIENDGPVVGRLDLSSSLDPKTTRPFAIPVYETAMKELLGRPLDISCVGQGDPEYPVTVRGSVKICRNEMLADRIRMVCDRGLFISLSDEMKYEQVHHEFATDVPGLEPDDGPISTYKISTQISAYCARPKWLNGLRSKERVPELLTINSRCFTKSAKLPAQGESDFKSPLNCIAFR